MGLFLFNATKADGVFSAIAFLMTDEKKTTIIGSLANSGRQSRSAIYFERICLECLAMEMAANEAFGTKKSLKKAKVVGGIYSKLFRHYNKLSPKVADAFGDMLPQRLNEYSNILKSQGISEAKIAQAFADHCNIPKNSNTISTINALFLSGSNTYRDFFERYF